MALSTSTNGSFNGQVNTQSPQTSAPSAAGSPPAAPGKSVQPGTATNLLSGAGGGSEGIPLTSTALTVANLNTSAQTSSNPSQQPDKSAASQHHPNVVLLVMVVVLVVFALVALWMTRRSEKNTTNY